MNAGQLPPERGFVTYTDGTTVFEGYVARPAGPASRMPCVLLAHEWSGLNAAMRRCADRLAALGYLCFAADVYGKGVRGDERGDNAHLMNPLLADRRLLRQRLLAGFEAARRLPGADARRMAAVGYCFGGLCALDLARAAAPGLVAAVSFHGVLQPPRIGPQGPIDASVLLLHGWEDPIAPPADVLGIATELTQAGADWQLHAYGHARHAFTFEGANFPERGIAYDAAADRRSWAACAAFLAERFAAAAIGTPA
ncbi:putative Carboxymethylenebutenolidase; Dienelactone hydrolase family [Cupriavidus taiwanensis]|uniref:Carboxymethylenebutenolidase Dienelactone hydrolase family n=1 Tax=Cupriavidus taiwanensis TaxID=164546 RepID=A0A375EB14_9BURK|nr:dienelactone hydrolase family protein [Cupriavidus taiwanensis]SOZ64637.1 putative Carboxymethylenebutenolidase; Dienelactone hydrolase family [Cupriavidus taiwanensis]SOZ65546.1 putative Carboxymethylenebutenolidase; Dienelactone hydrolase family [Cupriavidus taiwanensis]SOZ69206.1 putative Carboxymethylenebutenolidase; Dienelactone hydrolase family [Cupriavidus taiwanensis]SPA08385.1 putative Carboxymethylenebutenolidase; Dienelactone hydrolase family [Cupriavidus taiwanensis]SPA17512.1 p